MNARIQTRLVKERPNLGERLPLKTPLVMVVDPSSICNLRCRFCPTGYDDLIKSCTNRKQQIMSFDLFKKIIDDVLEFKNSINVLRLYKEGEPLVNPNFEDMVKYAKKCRGGVKRIDTTTNGLLLNPERNRKLIASGIDQINISVNGVDEGQYKKLTNREIDFGKFVSTIKDLYLNRGDCEIYIKSIKDNLTENEQQRFYEIFGEYADRIFLERIAEPWPHFKSEFIPDEVTWGNYDQPGEEKIACPYPFYIMVINSDGTVSSCIGDWKHQQILGDCNNESACSVWNGSVYIDFLKNHLHGKRYDYSMCDNCGVITYGCYDNIDEYADKVLKSLDRAAED